MDILNLLDQYFGFLVTEYGFRKSRSEFSEDNFIAVYESETLGLKLQNYHREIYLYSYSIDDPDKESAVYNVILFLKGLKKIDWDYFHDAIDLQESFRDQMKYTSTFLKENLGTLLLFYLPKGFQQRYLDLRKYIIALDPNTFATSAS